MAWYKAPERVVRRFDDWQRERWWVAHPIGTIRKYADDRGSAFASVVTYHVFLGMLPLLVVAITVLARFAEGSRQLRESLLDSTLSQIPVLGADLRDDIGSLTAAGPWFAVSIAGLLWTSTGVYTSLQLALNQVWNVEGVHRQGFVSRLLRANALFLLIVGAALGTAPLRAVQLWGPGALNAAVRMAIGVTVSIVLLLGVFRLVVSTAVTTRQLLAAAVLAGLIWQLLQRLGTWIVTRQFSQAGSLYGGLAFVVVVLLWINLLARAAIFANEWAVVSWKQLWPRRIAQPPLTAADREVLEALVYNERRRPEEHIEVWFDDDADEDATS